MARPVACSLVMLWVCQAALVTAQPRSQTPSNFRISGAFCGSGYAGASLQFAWPLMMGDEISLMRVQDDTLIATTAADASGAFKFSNVPPGIYRVGATGFVATAETVEITSANQRDCKRPLFVILFLYQDESERRSMIVEKLRPNFANATEVSSPERGRALAEANAGMSSEGDLDEAEKHFRAAIQMDPSYWLAHVNLAIVMFQRRMLPEAEAEYREAVRVGGRSEVPYWQLTAFLVDQHRMNDAESALNQAKKDGISSAGVSASFGLLAFQQRKWKEAEKHLRDALEFVPEALFGFRHQLQWETLLALTLSEQGKTREADERYDDLFDGGPDPWTLTMVAWAGRGMIDRGDHLEHAAAMMERARAAAPDKPEYLDSLGWANFKLGKLDLAAPQLTEAAERLPERPDVLEHLGELYAATGRKDLARQTLASALDHATRPEQRTRLTRRLKQLN